MESPAPSDLSSLLSASSYPVSPSLTQQRPLESDEDLPLYGVYCRFDDEAIENEPQIVGSPDPCEPTTSTHRTLPTEDEQTVIVPRKRGRPRKGAANKVEEIPAERRRAQIRQAQRAYRSRKEAALSRNEARIIQLEAALESMNTTIQSFGQHLAQTGMLASDRSLEAHLRRTIETCNRLVDQSDLTARNDHSLPSVRNEGFPSQRLSEQERTALFSPSSELRARLSNKPSPLSIVTLRDSPTPLNNGSPLLFDSSSVSMVELPVFIRQLRLACAYHAYFSLRNQSLTLNDLRRKFRFLLSMLNREDLTSYFEASLQARLYPARMNAWQEIPFFSVGGAGTHYPRSSSPSSVSPNSTQASQNQVPVREDPLAEFPQNVQQEMDGKWFDIRDLESFLAMRGLNLLSGSPHMTEKDSLRQGAINASRLIRNASVLVARLDGDLLRWKMLFIWPFGHNKGGKRIEQLIRFWKAFRKVGDRDCFAYYNSRRSQPPD